MMDIEKLCLQVIDIVKEVGAHVKKRRESDVEIEVKMKDVRSFVTEVDTESEKLLVEKLKSIFPQAGFITEEKTEKESVADYHWIIDPIDGTTNYIYDLPLYSISIALQHRDEIIMGVVFNIPQNEIYHTWKGSASYCNGKIISVSDCREMKDALIVTGFPYKRDEEKTQRLANTIKFFLDRTKDIRRFGSAAIDLCYIASGKFDGYYEAYLNLWDIAAGILLVENAGGVVTDFSGEKKFNKGEIIASNKFIAKGLLEGARLM